VEEQTAQCLENIKAVLEAAGAGLRDVIKVVLYLVDIQDFAKVNAVYAKYMGDHLPARSCVTVKELPADELMKIEVIARRV
jgi:2-iminobutanoate/2-iminopropanoate deaminase